MARTEITTFLHQGDTFFVEYPNGAVVKYIVTEMGPQTMVTYQTEQDKKAMSANRVDQEKK